MTPAQTRSIDVKRTGILLIVPGNALYDKISRPVPTEWAQWITTKKPTRRALLRIDTKSHQ